MRRGGEALEIRVIRWRIAIMCGEMFIELMTP